MKLELRLFPEFAEAFWPESPQTLAKQARSQLKTYFEVRENLIEIPEGRLGQLNEILEKLKRLWSQGKNLPLPFSLIPPGARSLFRPGRIYLTKKEAERLRPSLGGLPFAATLYEWQGLFELRIPATAYEEGLFAFRDLLLLGPYRPCPVCGLRWHKPRDCPALNLEEPYEAYLSWLKQKPEDFLKALARPFAEGKTQEGLKKLALRRPFFRPSFLRLFFTSNASTWETLPLKTGLTSGGNLFLGLEALGQGDFGKARERFEKCDLSRDFKALLALALTAALAETPAEALYFVEKAAELAQKPAELAFVLLFKGWLFELEGKGLEAEDFYQEALKKDRSCWPARILLAACQVKYAFPKAKNTLTPLLNEIMALPCLLTEGRFLPLAPELEAQAQSLYEKKQEEAVFRLAQAENALRPLIKALPEEEVKRFENTLAEIRREIYEGGFLELLTAERRAFDLGLELQGYLFRQGQKLRAKYKTYSKSLEYYQQFWHRFPYRRADDPYAHLLERLRQELDKLASLLKADLLKTLKRAYQQGEKIERILEELAREEARLRQEWRFRKQLSSFVKYFLILELVLFLVFMLVPALYHFLESRNPPPFFNLTSFLVLSFLALVFSLLRALNEKI